MKEQIQSKGKSSNAKPRMSHIFCGRGNGFAVFITSAPRSSCDNGDLGFRLECCLACLKVWACPQHTASPGHGGALL